MTQQPHDAPPLSRRIGHPTAVGVTLAIAICTFTFGVTVGGAEAGTGPFKPKSRWSTTASPSPSVSPSAAASPSAPASPAPSASTSPSASPATTVSSPAPATSPTSSLSTISLRIAPGQSWATVLAGAVPGTTVLVQNGVHPAQSLRAVAYGGVTLVGESRTSTVVQGIDLNGTSGLTVRNLTVKTATTHATSAVRLTNGASYIDLDQVTIDAGAQNGLELFNWAPAVAPHHVTLRNSWLESGRNTAANGRNVRIYGGNGGRATWPHTVALRSNTMRKASGDNIQIGGGRDISIVDNTIVDPQENDDHNDGVQSYGSDNLLISRNRFSAAGALSSTDQAIMLGHHPTYADYRVTNTRVENNLIARWRGAGINVAGVSTLMVVNNTSTHNYGSTQSSPKASMYVTNAHDGSVNTGLRIVNNVMDRLGRSGAVELEDYNCLRSGGTGAHDISADVQFADTTSFRLSSTSPCLDRGESASAPTLDLGGVTRQQPVDLGAWED